MRTGISDKELPCINSRSSGIADTFASWRSHQNTITTIITVPFVIDTSVAHKCCCAAITGVRGATVDIDINHLNRAGHTSQAQAQHHNKQQLSHDHTSFQ
jgi:hypothetical protein